MQFFLFIVIILIIVFFIAAFNEDITKEEKDMIDKMHEKDLF